MKNLISICSLTRHEIEKIIALTGKIKYEKKVKKGDKPLTGKILAMIFEKPSLRTRVTFEVGMIQLGGNTIYLSSEDVQLGKREAVSDVAKNLSRWVDVIMIRTYHQEKIEIMARTANIPVINGLSDLEHPCQVLGDFFTILEKKKSFKNLKICFIGDGNNVCYSLMFAAAKLGVNISLAIPDSYRPEKKYINMAQKDALVSGSKIEFLKDPYQAVKDADVVYTDVWTSMGKEKERKKRIKDFKNYQVNRKLLEKAHKGFIVMHCLPAHRGEEITGEVIDGLHSVVFDQAENRLHVQKAILTLLMKSKIRKSK